MRVAVLISGHLREFKKCFDSINTFLLQKYDCDVFISTWSTPGYWTPFDDKGVDDYCRETENIEDEVSIYNPVSLEIEELSLIEDKFKELSLKILEKNKNKKRWGRNKNIIGMYYKIWKCNSLRLEAEKLNDIKYDLIIRLRPDILIKNFDIENLDVYEDTLYTVVSNDLICDSFFFGTDKTMNRVCNIYKEFEEICDRGCLFDPHDILRESLSLYSVKLSTIKNFTYGIFNTPSGYCIEEKIQTLNERRKTSNAEQLFLSLTNLWTLDSVVYFSDKPPPDMKDTLSKKFFHITKSLYSSFIKSIDGINPLDIVYIDYKDKLETISVIYPKVIKNGLIILDNVITECSRDKLREILKEKGSNEIITLSNIILVKKS